MAVHKYVDKSVGGVAVVVLVVVQLILIVVVITVPIYAALGRVEAVMI